MKKQMIEGNGFVAINSGYTCRIKETKVFSRLSLHH